MIFYNPQLMNNEEELHLYLVSNPNPFTRYEDHEAALQINLYDLVEQSIQDKENPIVLIEGTLGITYNGGPTSDEITHFLLQTDQVQFAMHALRDYWSDLDDSLPEESVMYGSTTRQQAIRVFSEISLRTYLEALSKVYHV